MWKRARRDSAFLGAFVLALSRAAGAADTGLTTVDPETQRAASTPESTRGETAATGSPRVFEAFRYHVENVRTQRVSSGVSSMIVGAGLIGTGIYVQHEWDKELGMAIWIIGAIGAAGGGVTLLVKSEVEQMAGDHGVELTSAPSPEQEAALERDWEKAAEKAKTARKVGGAISFGLSAIALGATVIVAASDGIEDDTKQWLVPTLALSGTAFAAGGAVMLMVETPTEAAYGTYRATRGKSPPAFDPTSVRVGAAPLPGGGMVSLGTVF